MNNCHEQTRDDTFDRWTASDGNNLTEKEISDFSATRAVAIHLMYLLKYYHIFPLDEDQKDIRDVIENSLNILLEGKDTEMIDEITSYLFQNKFGR